MTRTQNDTPTITQAGADILANANTLIAAARQAATEDEDLPCDRASRRCNDLLDQANALLKTHLDL